MKVKVTGSYQIVHEGKRYTEGDTLDAPDGEAQQWVNAGYAEKVERKAEKAQSKSDNKAQASAPNKAQGSADKK